MATRGPDSKSAGTHRATARWKALDEPGPNLRLLGLIASLATVADNVEHVTSTDKPLAILGVLDGALHLLPTRHCTTADAFFEFQREFGQWQVQMPGQHPAAAVAELRECGTQTRHPSVALRNVQ